jgi:hypothetical protein
VEKVGLIRKRLNFRRFWKGTLYETKGVSSWLKRCPENERLNIINAQNLKWTNLKESLKLDRLLQNMAQILSALNHSSFHKVGTPFAKNK